MFRNKTLNFKIHAKYLLNRKLKELWNTATFEDSLDSNNDNDLLIIFYNIAICYVYYIFLVCEINYEENIIE